MLDHNRFVRDPLKSLIVRICFWQIHRLPLKQDHPDKAGLLFQILFETEQVED